MKKVRIFLLTIDKLLSVPEEYCMNFFPKRYISSKKFVFNEDRLRSIGVGVLLKEVLDLEEKDILIEKNGKPYSNKIDTKFSISHSGEYIVLAVGKNNIGVDIEKIDRNHLSIAEEVFNDYEISWINQNSEQGFFTLWTIKESISKLLGLGLSLPFKNLNALPVIKGEILEYNELKIAGKTTVIPGYCLSVCADSSEMISISLHSVDENRPKLLKKKDSDKNVTVFTHN